MDDNNSCRNCLYFRPHYAKDDDGEMYMLQTGHCVNTDVPVMKFRRSLKYECACYLWRAKEPDETPKESINDIIKNMATLIEQIATHLNIK